MTQIDSLQNLFYNKIIQFLGTQGIDVRIQDLQQNILISQHEIDSCIQNTSKTTPTNHKIKFKPKSKNNKIKFKPKHKHKPKKPKNNNTQYNLFIDLCNTNNLTYFQFNDEFEWTGPAIKINDSDYKSTIPIFNHFEYNQIKGTGFTVIRPTSFENDFHINYNIPSSVYSKSTKTNTSDDEDIVDTIEWEFRTEKYLLDTHNNDVYSINTHDIIGKRIYSDDYDDYIIEFN